VRSIVVGTAGHIDHGKSALVRALTGTDPDRLKEEQARGITIDLGFAHLELGEAHVAFVDVPGHERFVRNMLAGAGGIDAVLLVVAADESVMPQTREHFDICRLLHVPAGLIALTKCDAADADTIELARLEVRELVAGSFLDGAPIVEVSARTGDGLDALGAELQALAARVPPRAEGHPPRLPIDRVFTIKGFGTVATGTLVSGELSADQDAIVLPRGLGVKVRGLQVHGASTGRAAAGRRVAVNLGGVEVSDLARGDTLTLPGAYDATRRFDAVLDLLPGVRPLRHGARVRFHQGTTEVLGRVAVSAVCDVEGVPGEVPPGRTALVRMRLEAPAVLTRGDRFILRAYSPPVTIGGGLVLDPHPPRGAIRTPAGVARLARLALLDADQPVLQFVEEAGAAGLARDALVSRAGLAPAGAEATVARLRGLDALTVVGDRLVAPAMLAQLGARLLEAIAAHHKAEPLSDGLPREEARSRVFRRASPAVFEHVLATLAAAGKIVARERLALAGHALALAPEEAAARDAIDAAYREAGLGPPDLAAVAGSAGIAPKVAEKMADLLVRRKRLVRLAGLLFHADALASLKTEVRAMKGAGGSDVDVPSFKARYGISRKYAIPLLEYLDRERVTRRVGEKRTVI
jgi:selenocysteine-specific elongation factor